MMLSISDIKDLLKQNFPQYNYYLGTIDKSKNNSIGIYLRTASDSNIAIGGKKNTLYSVLPVTILFRGTEDAQETIENANKIYEFLHGLTNVTVNGKNISGIICLDSSPIDLSRDELNICELVIRIFVYYNKT